MRHTVKAQSIESFPTHEILGCINSISNTLDSFVDLETTLPKTLTCISKIIPLYSVVVVGQIEGRARRKVWLNPHTHNKLVRKDVQSATYAYSYLVDQGKNTPGMHERSLTTDYHRLNARHILIQKNELDGHSISLPLTMTQSSPFGVLQIKCCFPIEESALGIINFLANRLSISMERDSMVKRQQHLIASEQAALSAARKLQEENKVALAASIAKSQFLANMSHEIRTPLNIILGFSELLVTEETTAAKRSLYSDAIQKNGELLTHLIDDILDLSKVEQGKISLAKSDLSMTHLLNEISSTFSRQAAAKNISFAICRNSMVPERVYTDALRLKQILINIISNALKFTSEGGISVEVDLEKKSDTGGEARLVFRVTDTGRGITEEEKQKIFQPFVQADSTTTREYGGTGLGLILSKRLASAMGGDVTLIHSVRGKGSTFQASVALESPKEMTHDEGPLPIPFAADALAYCKVLVVDDAKDNVMLFTEILRYHGATVETAENGNEAIPKALAEDFDIILMDLQMPQKDGFTATQELRALGFDKPIVALTALAMKEERERAIRSGCTDHISKPVHAHQLVEKIIRLTDQYKRATQGLVIG